MIPPRSLTAAALRRSEAGSIVEGTTPDAAELLGARNPGGCEIAGSLLRFDLDSRIGRYQPVRDRDLIYHLDPLRHQRVAFQVRHRDPPVDPADPEPVEDIRHQLLKAHVLHPGNALGAAEISVGSVASRLALAGVVHEKLGHFAERSPFFAIVDDESHPALLRGLDADLDPMHQIGAAGADVRAKYVGAVALVMDAAGNHRGR